MGNFVDRAEEERIKFEKYWAVKRFVDEYFNISFHGLVGKHGSCLYNYFDKDKGMFIHTEVDIIKINLKSLEERALEFVKAYKKKFN